MAFAPPIAEGQFSYAGDSLFVSTSGNHVHRRATVAELNTHFTASFSDGPGHWYEAQLLHYGLPPSKTKGTAKMRLYEAVKKGCLAVPANLRATEADLKKKWTIVNRAAKVLSSQEGRNVTPKSPAKAKKTASGSGALGTVKATPSTASKAKATRGGSVLQGRVEKKPAKAKAAATTKPSRGGGAVQTARRGGGVQTARRGGARASSSSARSVASSAPPPYSEFDDGHGGGFYGDSYGGRAHLLDDRDGNSLPPRDGGYSDDSDDDGDRFSDHDDNESRGSYDSKDSRSRHSSEPHDEPPPRLGLLNGTYSLRPRGSGNGVTPRSADPQRDSLVLTLDGDLLWGWFEFGGLRGVLRLEGRPYSVDGDRTGIIWRGRNDEFYHAPARRDGTRGCPGQYLSFPGDGEVRGGVRFGGGRDDFCEFVAQRTSADNDSYSPISRFEMRDRWDTILDD